MKYNEDGSHLLKFVSKFSLATFKVEKNNKETNYPKGSEYQLQCQTLSVSVTRSSAHRQDQHPLREYALSKTELINKP